MRGKIPKGDLLASLVLGAAVAAAVCALNVSRDYGWARSVCDGAFVAAVLLLGMGGLKLARNKGTFDVAGYGLKYVIELALPILRHGEKEDLYQYRERKAQERKSSTGMLLAGGVFLIAAFAALGVYEMVA